MFPASFLFVCTVVVSQPEPGEEGCRPLTLGLAWLGHRPGRPGPGLGAGPSPRGSCCPCPEAAAGAQTTGKLPRESEAEAAGVARVVAAELNKAREAAALFPLIRRFREAFTAGTPILPSPERQPDVLL